MRCALLTNKLGTYFELCIINVGSIQEMTTEKTTKGEYERQGFENEPRFVC